MKPICSNFLWLSIFSAVCYLLRTRADERALSVTLQAPIHTRLGANGDYDSVDSVQRQATDRACVGGVANHNLYDLLLPRRDA